MDLNGILWTQNSFLINTISQDFHIKILGMFARRFEKVKSKRHG